MLKLINEITIFIPNHVYHINPHDPEHVLAFLIFHITQLLFEHTLQINSLSRWIGMSLDCQ